MNKKKFFVVLVVLLASVITFFHVENVAAGRSDDTQNIGESDGAQSGDVDEMGVNTRSVATVIDTAENMISKYGSLIDTYSNYTMASDGTLTFDASSDGKTLRDAINEATPGTTVELTLVFANKDVTITRTNPETGETITETILAGQPIAPIPMNDSDFGATTYKYEDAADRLRDGLASMFPDLDSSEINTQSLIETLADYDRLIAEGVRIDLLEDGSYVFADELKDLIKDLTEEEKEELIEMLTELTEDNPGDGTAPPSKGDPRCHDADNWGDTFGEVSVQNMNTNTGWQEDIWARPGDTIQFKIYYCWGAEAVAGTNGSSNSPFARTEYWGDGASNIFFQLSATQNERYLFGENGQYIGTSKHILSQPHNETIGAATAGEVPNNKVDSTGDYEFTLYSPGQKDGSNYNCMIFDFAPHFMGFGYQIPGVDTGSCAAIGQTGVMSDVSNEPGVISQSIEYGKVKAWKLWKHIEEGKCKECCPYSNEGNVISVNSGCDQNDNSRNGMTRQNINTRSDPFKTLEAARGAGGTHWGLVNKWAGDISRHEHDCASAECACSSASVTTYGESYAICQSPFVSSGMECVHPDNRFLRASPSGFNTESYTNSCTRLGQTFGPFTVYSGTLYPFSVTTTCKCTQHVRKYFRDTDIDYSTEYGNIAHPFNQGTEKKTATVNVPYSYRTAANSYLNEGEVVYLGQTVTSTFTVNILPRVVTEVRPGESYATLVDGFIQAVEFITDDVPSNGGVAPRDVPGDDLCNYFSSEACNEIWREGPKLNKEGRYRGADYSHQSLNVIPDDKDNLVGKKYCVAVGISTADSHNQVDAEVVSGMSNPSAWRISGVSCRTIAKKPNFQVWNGGLYTNGSIKTSATYKNVGVSLGGSADPTGVFGSWEEYYVVAAKDVRNFASGAALGYYPSLRPRGGKDPGALGSYCDATKKTISNEKCANGVTGNSGVTNTSQQIILERVYSRYALGGDNTSNAGKKLDNGARYVYKKTEDIKISDIVNAFHSVEIYNADRATYNCNYGTNALKMCQGQSAHAEQTTSNYADGTLIIHTGGKVTIDRNICYGTGACNNSSDVRLGNNSEYFTSMYGLPQVVIIADKGIDITANATQVDAWLVTNGAVNTCTNFTMGSPESACNSTLIVNGPVFADNMLLNRAGGAYPGAGSGSTVLNTNLSKTGSITPGEIFNLRPDTLYWAYSQAQRFTQATATYTRELAPRY